MRKQSLAVDWIIAKNDADWERLRQPFPPDSAPAASRTLRLNRSFWSVATLFLLLASAGGWLWHTDQVRAHEAEAEMTVTAQKELLAVEQVGETAAVSLPGDQTADDGQRLFTPADRDLLSHIEDFAPAAHIAIGVSTVEFIGEQAVAQVVTHTESKSPAYRQTRFYQRTAAGWLRTDPDAALWGPARSLETTFFVFHFRQNDAQVVISVVPQVDALYSTMRRNVGLGISFVDQPTMFLGEKLIIDVSVTQSPGQALYWYSTPVPLIVPSPALYLAPVELTDAELLAQSIALPLLEQVLAQASEHHAIGWSWQPLLKGLYLWQVWDLDLPLSAWRKDVVQWLYLDLLGTDPWQAVVLPERYTALSASHRLWLPWPALMGIPFLCAEPAGEDRFIATWGPRHPLLRLDQLALSMPPNEYVGQSSASYVAHPGQTVALATLVEYAVVTYGRERLPMLVAGLGQYDTWATLLPAVYGVSSAEFEAGWQAYLADHYAVPVDAAR